VAYVVISTRHVRTANSAVWLPNLIRSNICHSHHKPYKIIKHDVRVSFIGITLIWSLVKIGQVVQKCKSARTPHLARCFINLITRFLSSPKHPDQLWGPLSLLLNRNRCYSPRIKRPECEVDPSSEPSAEIKKKHRYNSAPPTTLHNVDMINYFSLLSLRNKIKVNVVCAGLCSGSLSPRHGASSGCG